MEYQRLAENVLRNQVLLHVDNDARFGAVAYFRSPQTGRTSLVKLLINPAFNTKFILDKIASGLLCCNHPGLLAMVNPPQIPYGLFPYSSNSKFMAFENFESDFSYLIEQKIDEKTSFSEAQLATMLRKVVNTLQFLAINNLHHGNISPENILLINGSPKLIPALFFEEANRGTPFKLTPYSPPEHVAIRKNGGPCPISDPHKADVFSLGVTLIHAALLDQFIPIQKKGLPAFDNEALIKNLCNLSPKYSVSFVVVLQRMTTTNLKNRPDLNQLSELLLTLNETVTVPPSMFNSVKTSLTTNRSDPGNSIAQPGPPPLTRMHSFRPPPVITTQEKVAHLTITIEKSPAEQTKMSGPMSAKLPVLKSSPCKPVQHKLIASPQCYPRSATARNSSSKEMVQSQQVLRLARMETVAEVETNTHILLTETTPDKTKKLEGGFGEIAEVVSTSSRNMLNNVAEFAAESQILANSIAESKVYSETEQVGALKDLFNFFPQLRFFNSVLKDAPLVEDEIKTNLMASQLTFSTALMKGRLVDNKSVHNSGEKGAEAVGVPMDVSAYFNEGASPTSPHPMPDYAATYAESRSNSNEPEELPPANIVREQYKDGSVYEGEKQFGKRHGMGQFNFKSGGQYKGAWFNGKMTGKGTLLYPDGSTAYEGEWLEGKFHGRGTLYNEMKPSEDLKTSFVSTYFHNFDDSNSWVKYEGAFSYDLREGTGTITFTDGSRFEGNFRSDKIDGYGKMYLANGEICEGIWADNRLSQIINASPRSRGMDATPSSAASRRNGRSPRVGTPALGMMMSPLSGTGRNLSSFVSPEPIIKPKAC